MRRPCHNIAFLITKWGLCFVIWQSCQNNQIWEAEWCLCSAVLRDGSQWQPQTPPLRYVVEDKGCQGRRDSWPAGSSAGGSPIFWALPGPEGRKAPAPMLRQACSPSWDFTDHWPLQPVHGHQIQNPRWVETHLLPPGKLFALSELCWNSSFAEGESWTNWP